MNDTRITTHTTAKRHDDRRFRMLSKPPIRVGEMTYMVLITVSAALQAGVLALPITMPDRAFADAATAFNAADFGPSTRIRTATRLT